MLALITHRLKSFIQTSSFLSGVLVMLFSIIGFSSFGQDFTNKGMEFYVCFPPQVITGGTNFPNMSLFITSDMPSKGQVLIPGSATPVPFTLATAQSVQEISIPYSTAYFGDGNGSFLGKGIRVVVNPNESPVVVYAHIYVAARSAASLILPTDVLGKKYITANCYQKSNDPSSRSQFQIVAVEDNTQLKITPRQDGVVQASFTTTLLNKGDVFQYQSTQDLTGSLIESVEPGTGGSCKRIAVFSGSSAVYIETSNGCSSTQNISIDPLFQQLFPINTWGKKYAFVPFADYVNGNPYRVIAAEDGTAAYENGNFKATINAGGFYQSMNLLTGVMDPLNAPVFITASKPVSVVQYAQMARCRGASPYTLGDPEMLLLNPIDQGVNNITVFSSLKENIAERFIQVVIKQEAAASFQINSGSFYFNSPWTSLSPLAEGYVYNQIPISTTSTTNSFTLTANQDFVASVYGFGQTESYAYSAGANFKDLSQTLNTLNGDTLINFPASCAGTPMKFSITSPYRVTSIKWDFQGLFTFSGGSLDTTLLPISPATLLDFDSTWVVDGKSFYRYDLKKLFTVSTALEKSVKVSATIINPDGCSGVQEITYKLKIYEPPVARIKQNFLGAVCLGSPVNLVDSSDGKGRAIQKSIWVDIPGGEVSVGPSWSKIYTSSGSKRVGHLVLNDIGCVSDTFFEGILVNPLPVADFAAGSVICDRKTITFTNTSVANAGGVSTLQWTLPNGTTSTASSVSYGFASSGSQLIRLRITNSNGCADDLDSTLTVYPTPGAFFELPKICRYDPAILTAVNNSPNVTISNYSWTISGGVIGTTPSINLLFSVSGPQVISLKTVSADGCDSTITRTMVINGEQPRPIFTTNTPSPFCANTLYKLTDASTVLDGGSILKIEVLWDAQNDPSADTLDLSPQPGSSYTYSYPSFTNPPFKSYEIHYRVYSGESIACSYDSVFTIQVAASPGVIFPPVGPVCRDSTPFFLVATDSNNVSGTGIFSGPGVTAAGLFSPKTALDTNLVIYSIPGLNGCLGTGQQKIVVWPSPVADAGPPVSTVQAGNSLTLSGTVNTGLPPFTYQWKPPSLITGSNTNSVVMVTPAQNTLFHFVVTDNRGCKGMDSILVKVLQTLKIPPNTFTPNGDLVNDTWRIENIDAYPGATVQIFNRYGQLVFRSAGYAKEWDGTLNGNPLPVGTYYWVIDPKNGKPPMSGSVTLIR